MPPAGQPATPVPPLASSRTELVHGAVSSDMAIWQDGRWHSARDLYSADKAELKKLIGILMETPYEDLDAWDDRTLREWMLQHTRNEGVIELWEFDNAHRCVGSARGGSALQALIGRLSEPAGGTEIGAALALLD